ncbi:MAG: Asp23/Gls24 family envelope stress response protein [Candidatus Omnitrophica bacterium CG07_land_8_20_14_0_80_42_15]|uniref:Asp23/Gls24 family envelope stress response protein n=1 Tax=Candidatus Aquitaenariimonas noxiae TaxID=1974741 RepID=A0A2J0KRR6_9BACT|nr:MAG: Asp23/Gls24 family envelope stress response protein [Candidatus Omnitrophica bacterium CG07_land_8_20_14_0_80_42_15]
MMRKEEKTELGFIKIHNDVIGTIASLAACEIEGVARTGEKAAKNIFDLIKKKHKKGVKVESLNENDVKLTIDIVVKYGTNIPHMAARVQENVRKNVEKMTGLALSEVNLNIQGVAFPDKESLETIYKTESKQEVKR